MDLNSKFTEKLDKLGDNASTKDIREEAKKMLEEAKTITESMGTEQADEYIDAFLAQYEARENE